MKMNKCKKCGKDIKENESVCMQCKMQKTEKTRNIVGTIASIGVGVGLVFLKKILRK